MPEIAAQCILEFVWGYFQHVGVGFRIFVEYLQTYLLNSVLHPRPCSDLTVFIAHRRWSQLRLRDLKGRSDWKRQFPEVVSVLTGDAADKVCLWSLGAEKHVRKTSNEPPWKKKKVCWVTYLTFPKSWKWPGQTCCCSFWLHEQWCPVLSGGKLFQLCNQTFHSCLNTMEDMEPYVLLAWFWNRIKATET